MQSSSYHRHIPLGDETGAAGATGSHGLICINSATAADQDETADDNQAEDARANR